MLYSYQVIFQSNTSFCCSCCIKNFEWVIQVCPIPLQTWTILSLLGPLRSKYKRSRPQGKNVVVNDSFFSPKRNKCIKYERCTPCHSKEGHLGSYGQGEEKQQTCFYLKGFGLESDPYILFKQPTWQQHQTQMMIPWKETANLYAKHRQFIGSLSTLLLLKSAKCILLAMLRLCCLQPWCALELNITP